MPKTKKTSRGKVITKPPSGKKAGRPPMAAERTPEQIQAAARALREKSRNEFKGTGALDRQTMVAPQRAGFYRRFVNDNKGRIDMLLQKGYYFVSKNQEGSFLPTDSLSKAFVKRAGTKEDGTPLFGYLMELPEDMYREDQQAKENRILAKEEVIRNGSGDGTGLSPDVSYDPTEGKGQNNFFK